VKDAIDRMLLYAYYKQCNPQYIVELRGNQIMVKSNVKIEKYKESVMNKFTGAVEKIDENHETVYYKWFGFELGIMV